jgi:Dipeptidyl peptidase IV (DPP IV) N-terminal region
VLCLLTVTALLCCTRTTYSHTTCSVEPTASTSSVTPVQITFGAAESIKHGLAGFIAQEEMDRYVGYWWSLDSTKIAYTQVDESHIPAYRIMHQGKDTVDTQTTQEDHHYPFAGQDNPKVCTCIHVCCACYNIVLLVSNTVHKLAVLQLLSSEQHVASAYVMYTICV